MQGDAVTDHRSVCVTRAPSAQEREVSAVADAPGRAATTVCVWCSANGHHGVSSATAVSADWGETFRSVGWIVSHDVLGLVWSQTES
jgi:hypothetical protein